MIPITLAIDFGTKRIGVAVSRGSLAEPLCIIPNDENVIHQLHSLITREQAARVLMGISENTMAELTRAFAAKLQPFISAPIIFTDETLSSYEVHEKLRSSSLKKRQAPIDHYAAAHILQNWLDSLSDTTMRE